MAYKGDTWFRKKGDLNFRHFMIKSSFVSKDDRVEFWQDEIGSQLPGWPYVWETNIKNYDSVYGKYHISFRRYKNKESGHKEGLEITISRFGLSAKQTDPDPQMSKKVFGEYNRSGMWTGDIENIGTMVKEFDKRVASTKESIDK